MGRTSSRGKLKSQGAYFLGGLHDCLLKEGKYKLFTSSLQFSVLLTLFFFLPCGSGDLCLQCTPILPSHLCQQFLHISLVVVLCCVIHEPANTGKKGKEQILASLCGAHGHHVSFSGEAATRELLSLCYLGPEHALCLQNTKWFFIFKLLRNLCPFCCL